MGKEGHASIRHVGKRLGRAGQGFGRARTRLGHAELWYAARVLKGFGGG